MKAFTDAYGTKLTFSPGADHSVNMNITEQTAVSFTVAPEWVLILGRVILDATRLSHRELERAQAGKKLKVNRYTRLGEAEAPIGELKDAAGNEIFIYPDKANHALIEIIGKHTTNSFSLDPKDALDLKDALLVTTGVKSGEELAIMGVRAGTLDASKPKNRHALKKDQRMRRENPAYARVLNTLAQQEKHTGASFGIGKVAA